MDHKITKVKALELAIQALQGRIQITKLDNPKYTPDSEFSLYYEEVLKVLERLLVQIKHIEGLEIGGEIEFSE